MDREKDASENALRELYASIGAEGGPSAHELGATQWEAAAHDAPVRAVAGLRLNADPGAKVGAMAQKMVCYRDKQGGSRCWDGAVFAR